MHLRITTVSYLPGHEIQRAFIHQRNQKVLPEVDESIKWESIEQIVTENYPTGQSELGIKSDPDFESQINDRISFKAFMGFSLCAGCFTG